MFPPKGRLMIQVAGLFELYILNVPGVIYHS